MNILHLSRTMSHGGAQKIVYQLATGCKSRGHHIVVVSSGGAYVEMLQREGILHYEICDLECKNIGAICQTLKILIRVVKKEKIEIIHTHHRMAAVYGAILKMIFPKIQLVYTAHNVFYNKKFSTRFGMRKAHVVAVGKNVKNNLTEYFKMDAKKIQVIYNAIDPVEEKSFDPVLEKWRKDGYILIGIVGRLTEQKGMDVFVKALSIAKKHQSLLKGVIIGDGELREGLKQLIASLNLNGDIYMMGYQDNVTALMKELDFAVMPSRWEGFPLTPIELFSVGKTLIASDIGGINEIIVNGKNGILVPKDDYKAFAKEIFRLSKDRELRTRMEQKGIEYYHRYVNYDKFMEQYAALYKKVL